MVVSILKFSCEIKLNEEFIDDILYNTIYSSSRTSILANSKLMKCIVEHIKSNTSHQSPRVYGYKFILDQDPRAFIVSLVEEAIDNYGPIEEEKPLDK
jgi:hypothetical protein